MTCPHCGYAEGFRPDAITGKVEKYEGRFYMVSNDIEMVRGDRIKEEKMDLYGCPKCKGVFMA